MRLEPIIVEVVDGDDEYGEEERAIDTRSVQIVHGRDEKYQVEGWYVGAVVLVSNNDGRS